jgi:hypothetical protein
MDVGCGGGSWLQVWKELGVDDLTGVDSEPPRRPVCYAWKVWDLTRPMDLGRKVDLVQCLEVGEHLPTDAASTLVASLTRHAQVILFSAALPGQGGWQHINERPPAYWRTLFETHGFAIFDCLRPKMRRVKAVRLSTAYNTFLYAHSDAWPRLPAEVLQSRISLDEPIPDHSPTWLRAARAFIRIWPVRWVSWADRAFQLGSHWYSAGRGDFGTGEIRRTNLSADPTKPSSGARDP